MNRSLFVTGLVTLCATPAFARPLVTTLTDTTAGNTIGTYNYAGGGIGFGGTVGGGSISFDSDNTNLYIRFTAGNALNDLVAIMLDTRAGGFVDSQMDDQGDGGRRAVSNLANNADNAFDPSFLPDFGLVLGGFGSVLFELTAGNTPNHLNFVSFDGDGSLPRNYTIPLATLGVAPGGNVDFFVAYTSDSGYMSNESIPAYAPLNGGDNPGFDGAAAVGNYDRFTTIPTPGSLALLGLAGLTAARRRRA